MCLIFTILEHGDDYACNNNDNSVYGVYNDNHGHEHPHGGCSSVHAAAYESDSLVMPYMHIKYIKIHTSALTVTSVNTHMYQVMFTQDPVW